LKLSTQLKDVTYSCKIGHVPMKQIFRVTDTQSSSLGIDVMSDSMVQCVYTK